MTKKGYKAFDSNLACRGFQFVVGVTYTQKEDLRICNNGFHFCEQLKDVYNYYPKNYYTRICEIEATGEVQTEGVKSCTSQIRIIRELTKDEIKALTDDLKFNSGNRNSGYYNSGDFNSGDLNSGNYNSGDFNSGNYNSGNRNSGYDNSGDLNSGNYNSGNYNSGNRNSGNRNSGYYNSGDYNSGNYNSGNYNSGNRNSGYYNSGYDNSGDFNSGNYNSGFFNTNTPKVRLFNQDTDLDFSNKIIQKLRQLDVKPILQWVYESSMTEEEKQNYPSHKTTGGYLKNTGKQDWSKLTNEDKALIKSLPGFDDEIFQQIAGISLLK